jgi:hypothetical protein
LCAPQQKPKQENKAQGPACKEQGGKNPSRCVERGHKGADRKRKQKTTQHTGNQQVPSTPAEIRQYASQGKWQQTAQNLGADTATPLQDAAANLVQAWRRHLRADQTSYTGPNGETNQQRYHPVLHRGYANIMIKKSVHPSALHFHSRPDSGGASRHNSHRTPHQMRIYIILLFYYTPNSGKIQGLFTKNTVFVNYVHFLCKSRYVNF